MSKSREAKKVEATENSMTVVGWYKKNEREQVRITVGQYRGVQRADIRIWYLHKESGEFKPSQKGVSVEQKKVKPLLQALKAARRQMRSSEQECAD